MNVRDFIKDNVLLFDGGMGTYFAGKGRQALSACETANLQAPETIRAIHREYIDAGAKAIKTNTFAANRVAFSGDDKQAETVLRAGYSLAKEAAEGKNVYVFADIGPVSAEEANSTACEEYKWIVDVFLDEGAENFLFETNSSMNGLREVAEYIKAKNPDAYIIVSFAAGGDGFTRDGEFVSDIFKAMKEVTAIDALGLNCVSGARHMLDLVKTLDTDGIVLSLMPNAGYPIVLGNRTVYEGAPDYFASQVGEMVAGGAKIVGGCCGTTPLHIREVAKVLANGISARTEDKKVASDAKEDDRVVSPFWEKLSSGKKVIAVELDPPEDISVAKFMSGASALKDTGVDIITIADCPIARARMDSSILACKVKREVGIEALPHMTCRDRNLNATKALLLGLYAEEIRNVLLVTGDPVPTAERDEVKSVYQFNSRKLVSFVSAFGEKSLPTPFNLFCALNLNARNFDRQLEFAKEKEERGCVGFLTQPVLTEQAFENLKRARAELKGFILGGIIPVVSQRNAQYMDSEINGINVDQKIIDMYEGKTREEAEELAVAISTEIAHRIEPFVDGYYLMTPFQRVNLIKTIIEGI